VNVQARELRLELTVALGQLRADEVERVQRLLEREQMLGAPVALQALGDLLGANQAVERTRRFMASTWRSSARAPVTLHG
jgi:hypothetical protein